MVLAQALADKVDAQVRRNMAPQGVNERIENAAAQIERVGPVEDLLDKVGLPPAVAMLPRAIEPDGSRNMSLAMARTSASLCW